MSSSSRRGLLLRIAILLALAVVALAGLFLAISRQMSAHNVEVRGLAADYSQLGATPVIGERIAYFPPGAKNIEYWCKPYWSGINGSFDINEKDYLDWAQRMGWQLRELQPTELGPSIQVVHPDGSNEYIQPPNNCYFYKYQVFRNRHLRRDFQIMYDRTRKRAYFADSDGHAGPPPAGRAD